MSGQLEENVKRWTAKRKSALVIEIIQGSSKGPWPQWGRVSPEEHRGRRKPVV